MKLSYTKEDKYGSITVTVEYEPTDDAVVEVLSATGQGDISGILTNISNFDKWIDEIDWKSIYQQKKQNP